MVRQGARWPARLAGSGGPDAGLGHGPPPGLLDLVAAAAARRAVAGAGPAALVVGGRVLEIAAAGVPRAGRERALAVADLNQVPQRVAGLVAARLMPVIAIGHRHRAEPDGKLPPAGQGERPRPVPARRAGAGAAGERPRAVPAARRRG